MHAPEIDLSAEFVTTIWRDNVATDLLAENKRIVDEIVKRKVHSKMSPQQIKECIIEACIVEHSVDELAKLLNKVPGHLRNRFIPELVADGVLLSNKPRHSPEKKGKVYSLKSTI